jgi:hypothetical protein
MLMRRAAGPGAIVTQLFQFAVAFSTQLTNSVG